MVRQNPILDLPEVHTPRTRPKKPSLTVCVGGGHTQGQSLVEGLPEQKYFQWDFFEVSRPRDPVTPAALPTAAPLVEPNAEQDAALARLRKGLANLAVKGWATPREAPPPDHVHAPDPCPVVRRSKRHLKRSDSVRMTRFSTSDAEMAGH